VQQTEDEVRIEIEPQRPDESEAGTSNKRGARTIIQMRPAPRFKTSSLQAQEREEEQKEVEMDSQWPDTCV
jgi:hypothetical protein